MVLVSDATDSLGDFNHDQGLSLPPRARDVVGHKTLAQMLCSIKGAEWLKTALSEHATIHEKGQTLASLPVRL